MDPAYFAENMDLAVRPNASSPDRDQATSTSQNQNQADASTQTQPRSELPPNPDQATRVSQTQLQIGSSLLDQPWPGLSPSMVRFIQQIQSEEKLRVLRQISYKLLGKQRSIERVPQWREDIRLRTTYQNFEAVKVLLQRIQVTPSIMPASNVGDRMAIPIIIQRIYCDLDHQARTLETAEADILYIETRRLIDTFRFGHTARFNAAESLSVIPAFHYLLLSKSFIYAAVELNEPTFNALLGMLKENAASLIIFARVRLPSPSYINTMFTGLLRCYLGISRKRDVHWYVVPGERQPLAITPTFVETIEDNVFDINDFRSIDAPSGWSDTVVWPSHPGKRHLGTTCDLCGSFQLCDCQPPKASDIDHLVEIYNYGIRGRGIRTLTRLSNTEIIGEYVGHFRHVNAETDDRWTIYFTNPPTDEAFNNIPIAKLDASSEGNWTRFLNHHCSAPNVKFVHVNLGRYRRVLVQALRNIELYEELLVTYSPDYWERHICRCGSETCIKATGLATPAKPSQEPTNNASETTSTNPPPPQQQPENKTESKRSYLMPTQLHSDISDSSASESIVVVPPRGGTRTKKKKAAAAAASTTTKKAKEQAKPPQTNNNQVSVPSKKDQDYASQRYAEALARRADKRAARRERTAWQKRWIGQENADRPRSKGVKSAGPYFAEF